MAWYFGPLAQLHWMGRLCPCLQSEADVSARQALQHVQGQSIQYLPLATKEKKGILSSFFGTVNIAPSSDNGSNEAVRAKMSWSDRVENQPSLCVVSLDETMQQSTQELDPIMLCRIDKVTTDPVTGESLF